jgi:hypothetical protein
VSKAFLDIYAWHPDVGYAVLAPSLSVSGQRRCCQRRLPGEALGSTASTQVKPGFHHVAGAGSTASPGVANRMTGATGPKTSSSYAGVPGPAPVRTVGDRKSPEPADHDYPGASRSPMAEYFRLNAEEATDVLMRVSSAVGRWRAVAATHGLQQADINAMEPAFEHAERTRAQALAAKRPR